MRGAFCYNVKGFSGSDAGFGVGSSLSVSRSPAFDGKHAQAANS